MTWKMSFVLVIIATMLGCGKGDENVGVDKPSATHDPQHNDHPAKHLKDLKNVRIVPPNVQPPDTYQGGLAVYRQHCVSCHGEQCAGTDRGPPLLHPYYNPNDHDDEIFMAAITNGTKPHLWNFGEMPAQTQVTDKQARAIIAYIRWLQRQAGIY